MAIKSICTKNLATVCKEASVKEAAEVMSKRHVGSVLVVDESSDHKSKMLGVLTDRDIVLKVIAKGLSADTTKVAQVMTKNPNSVEKDTGIFETLKTMQKYGVKRMPLVDKKKNLVGIVSSDDVLHLLADELMQISRLSHRQKTREVSAYC